MKSILVIDDEATLRKALDRYLSQQGYQVSTASEGEQGLALLRQKSFDLLLVDLMLPKISGIEVIRQARQIDPTISSIVMTGFGTIASAVEAIQAGAYHYVTKPFELETLHALIEKALEHALLKEENRRLRSQLKEQYELKKILGESPVIREVLRLVAKVADTDSTVLISGASGTGKEILARTIHAHSRRIDGPFMAINCGAIPEGLLESELFGSMKGAFTGATATRTGKFQEADGGTLFLDEIGEMSLALQVKVLRALQEKSFQPVGSSKTHEVDIRIIAATNQDLEKAIAEGRFRQDLFYRLNVIPIHLPSLAERREDIPILARHFLEKCSRENHKKMKDFSPEVMDRLMDYPWPGNVRELENAIERLVILKGSGTIEVEDLRVIFSGGMAESTTHEPALSDKGVNLRTLVEKFEGELIHQALRKTHGNKNRAAELLKLNRTTLIQKIKRMGESEQRKRQ